MKCHVLSECWSILLPVNMSKKSWMFDSVVPDWMSCFVASDMGLHNLFMPLCQNIKGKYSFLC